MQSALPREETQNAEQLNKANEELKASCKFIDFQKLKRIKISMDILSNKIRTRK